MIIICDKCSKKFNVNDEDIPKKGRSLQCGSCGNKWFFTPILNEKLSDQKIDGDIVRDEDEVSSEEINLPPDEIYNEEIKIPKKIIAKNIDKKEIAPKKVINAKPDEKVSKRKYNYISNFFVIIITFIAIAILLDTFKNELSQIFPGIITLLDNLYQTLYDIYLFFKDLIN